MISNVKLTVILARPTGFFTVQVLIRANLKTRYWCYCILALYYETINGKQ